MAGSETTRGAVGEASRDRDGYCDALPCTAFLRRRTDGPGQAGLAATRLVLAPVVGLLSRVDACARASMLVEPPPQFRLHGWGGRSCPAGRIAEETELGSR